MSVKPLFPAMIVCCGLHNAVAGHTRFGIAYKAIHTPDTLHNLRNRRTAP
ncbi:hypothetical protein [Pseudomonas saponiphila]|nr:hypothetical protein [Pseudomonas saponiphila]